MIAVCGVVTLSGTVHWYHQLREAENEALRVTGVRDVLDEIAIEPAIVAIRCTARFAIGSREIRQRWRRGESRA